MTVINLDADFPVETYTNKKYYIQLMVRAVRNHGGVDFWVLNKQYLEIYHFKATQISDFDMQIDINNALVGEHVFSGVFVLHMKDHIATLLDEVPGTIYVSKLDCYRELYRSLYEKASKTKTKKIKTELVEKIDYIEVEFPQLVI
jgi:hypothetical protein